MSLLAEKPSTVFPRRESTKNDTAKGPAVPKAAAVPPPTASSSAIANAASAPVVADSSSTVSSLVAVEPSQSTIPSIPSIPISVTQAQPAPASVLPAATSTFYPSGDVTSSLVLPNSPTPSTQQLLVAASSPTPDDVVTSSSSTSSPLETSTPPPTQPVVVTSSNLPVSAAAFVVPTSSFETLPSLSSASATTIQPTGLISSISNVRITPSTVPQSAAAGRSTATTPAVTGANSSAPPNSRVGVVIGGVIGGLALVGILLVFCWRYQRKRETRHSLLTPLSGQFNDGCRSEKYEIDGNSLGPTGRGKRWRAQAVGIYSRAQIGVGNLQSSFKAKLGGRDNTPTINMDRGNSQFLEQSPQHSRSGSATSVGALDVYTRGERFRDRWNHFTQKVMFNWRLHTGAGKSSGRSATTGTRSKKETRRDQRRPDFPRLLPSRDGEPRLGSSGHRRSLSTAGLDFSPLSNPFADSHLSTQPTISDLTKPPTALTSNPFQSSLDPASIASTKPNSSNYLVNVQRSRGLSQPGVASSVSGARPLGAGATNVGPPPRYPSTVSAAQPSSRYPSIIRTSLESSRDTVLSAYSTSGRKTKCRSDPFDLERPELLHPAMPATPDSQLNSTTFLHTSSRSASQARIQIQPRDENIPASRMRIVSMANSLASSKYSSGASDVLNEWSGSGLNQGSFAWDITAPIPPPDRRVSPNLTQGGGVVNENTEGVVGRAL